MSKVKGLKSEAEKYDKKTPREHVLLRPDTYIGDIEPTSEPMWIYSSEDKNMIKKQITYTPGFLKVFDELLVNARDAAVNDPTCDTIKVDYNIEEGYISVYNNGDVGIPVEEHPVHKTLVPSMIFGELLTSSNYDDNDERITGGRNGLGAKLCCIFATKFVVEIDDAKRNKRFKQEWTENMLNVSKAEVIKLPAKVRSSVKITFYPDFKRFGIKSLKNDHESLFYRRTIDIAGTSNNKMKVFFNEQKVEVNNFKSYIEMYYPAESNELYFDNPSDRWTVGVLYKPDSGGEVVSFVNSINTYRGGTHCGHVTDNLIKTLINDYIKKKDKDIKVTPALLKENLIFFINSVIINPAFSSQTKDTLTSKVDKFGSKYEPTPAFLKKLAKCGIVEQVIELAKFKENAGLKKTDGKKQVKIAGIPKLEDANKAGTNESMKCTLILTEGDSAKAGIISGLSSDDRNIIGVYPMKGKILNVRGENVKKISENKEITEIKKILGLETGKKYNTIEDVYKQLRYGKVLFMTDQDLDGSHIKGLGINLFQSEWPTLANIPGFIGFMNTPILKAKKGAVELEFYNDGEYNEWKEENDVKGWKIKYYKGLGTSTGKEFREYFEKRKVVGFQHSDKSDDAIDMVFNKKRADDRKDWLKFYDRDAYLDTAKTNVSYEEFINRELIHFSKYDCDRSIPNLMDGLKISLRKILFSAFKKNLTTEIKVAQFSGYVSEHSGYHHGEASLNGAIVGMAQNFVGSNNINLLLPNGQFGTRLQGGKDSASERYIFTQLNKITRSIFPSTDDNVLTYLNDDGLLVEPIYYAPIIPMVLVNGSKGIGTGFSTDIMCYNPLQIIDYLNHKLLSTDGAIDFIPYYEGFTGRITKISDDKFLIKGVYEKLAVDKIKVTELPVGYWTEDFKELIEYLIEPGVDKDGKKIPATIKDYEDMSKDTNVDFTITFMKGKLDELEATSCDHGCNGLEKLLKLYTTNTTTNMHLFDAKDTLQKYNKISEIIDAYYDVRLDLYGVRKAYMINALEKELVLLSNKAKYIQETLDGTIDLRKKKKDYIVEMLQQKGYDKLEDDDEYRYLVKMPMDSVTEENVTKLLKDRSDKLAELSMIKATSVNQMWKSELDQLKDQYVEYKEARARLMAGEDKKKKVVAKGVVKKSVKKALMVVEGD